jgi:hypothetical protein
VPGLPALIDAAAWLRVVYPVRDHPWHPPRPPAGDRVGGSVSELDEAEQNKLAKFYFTQCSDDNGNIDWDKVDGSNDFSVIPTNSKGNILMTVGDLRTMIADITRYYLSGWDQCKCHDVEKPVEHG